MDRSPKSVNSVIIYSTSICWKSL